MAASGTAVKLKRLRQRFGISAPKVAVRTHIAWYWWMAAGITTLTVSLVLAAWIYDAGRSIAGFDSHATGQQIGELKARVAELEAELSAVRGVASAADSSVKIERVAQQQMVQQIRALESENAGLKQDLAFFEGLLPDTLSGEPGVRINRFRIERDAVGGQYFFRMLVVHNATRQQKEFKGDLQLVLKLQRDGKDVMIDIPAAADSDKQRYKLDVKHFQRVEGTLPVPGGAVLKSVEARILHEGTVRARQVVNL